MKDDRSEELERLEKELLAAMEAHDEEQDEFEIIDEEPDILADELIRELMAEPAFEDPDRIHDPEEPLVYCNYSNDYGRDLKDFAENGGKTDKNKSDKVDMALMITASALCLGIIGVLAYWLVMYL